MPMSQSELVALVESLTEDQEQLLIATLTRIAKTRKIEALRASAKLLSQREDFVVGQIVAWKPGLRNKKLPEDHDPAVVLQILETPVFDPAADSGGPYFREPLDLVLGILDEDGDFVACHFDSRRFTKHELDE